MLCVKCGFQNSGGAKYCSKCNAQLPRVLHGPQEEVEPDTPRVQDRLQQIEAAAARAASGEWNPEEFGRFLEETAGILAEKEQAIRDIPIPDEAVEDFREELEVGYMGIDLYTQGVQRMFDFVAETNPLILEEGLELVRQGNEFVNQAMRINRENRRKLEEMSTDASSLM
ncbi:MAG: zinc ribbon domain-containing protein [Candidatus Xenobium sp.]